LGILSIDFHVAFGIAWKQRQSGSTLVWLSFADMNYDRDGTPTTAPEVIVSNNHSRYSFTRRMLRMFLNWVILGALVGPIGNLQSAPYAHIFAGAISGMIVLAIPGLCLGLIGGDVKGSYVGAAGAYLGCWFGELTEGVSIPSTGIQVMVVFGALAGATFLIYLRTAFWTYGMIARGAFRLLGRVPALERSHSRTVVESAHGSPKFWIRRPRCSP
jgi:hypothetical protein